MPMAVFRFLLRTGARGTRPLGCGSILFAVCNQDNLGIPKVGSCLNGGTAAPPLQRESDIKRRFVEDDGVVVEIRVAAEQLGS